MTIPSGFFADLTKNYYGLDPASQSAKDQQASATLWENFLTKVSPTEQPYVDILSSTDEVAINQALIFVASSSGSQLSDTDVKNLETLAQALTANRGNSSLSDLTSNDPQKVQTVLTNLMSSQLNSDDPFLTTLLPSIAEDIATQNTQIQKLYFDYLADQISTTNLSNATNALSPDETKKRELTYTIMEIMFTLLNTMSSAQILSANSQSILVDQKQAYVTMMQRMYMYQQKGFLFNSTAGSTVDTYFEDPTSNQIDKLNIKMGSEDTTLTRPTFSEDPSQYNLGYGNIQLQDVFNYVYTNAVNPPAPSPPQGTNTGSGSGSGSGPGSGPGTASGLSPSPTFELDSGIWKTGSTYYKNRCVISCTKDPTTGVLTVSATFDYLQSSGSTTWISAQNYTSSQQITPSSQENTENQVMAALSSTFYSVYNDALKAGYVHLDTTNPTPPQDATDKTTLETQVVQELKMPWGFVNLSSSTNSPTYAGYQLPNVKTDANTQQDMSSTSQQRSQINQTLNSYLQSISSQMSMIGDKVDSQGQMQSSASSERSQTINVVKSIVRQLQNIISAIYK